MIDIQSGPLEDDNLSLNAKYIFSCLVLDDGSMAADKSLIEKGIAELVEHGYLSAEDISNGYEKT